MTWSILYRLPVSFGCSVSPVLLLLPMPPPSLPPRAPTPTLSYPHGFVSPLHFFLSRPFLSFCSSFMCAPPHSLDATHAPASTSPPFSVFLRLVLLFLLLVLRILSLSPFIASSSLLGVRTFFFLLHFSFFFLSFLSYRGHFFPVFHYCGFSHFWCVFICFSCSSSSRSSRVS